MRTLQVRDDLLDCVADNVRRETGLPTAAADVVRILSAVQTAEEIWLVVDLAKRPFNLVVEATRQLAELGLVTLGDGVRLTEAGRALCRRQRIAPLRLHSCPACAGRGVDLSGLGDAVARFGRLAPRRPRALVEYDQAPVTVETTLARIAFMAQHGDLADRDLLVLGDDDLMGLAAALTGLPRRVVVLEVDARLVAFMGDAAAEERVPLEILTHDLRELLPDSVAGCFDTFFTDPPDTLAGLELFISRGLSSLRGPGCAGYFGTGLVEASLYKWRALQRSLLGRDEALVVTDLIQDFNVYARWDYLAETVPQDIPPLRRAPSRDWYKTALCRVELLSQNSDLERHMKGENPYLDRESLIWTRRGVKNAAGT